MDEEIVDVVDEQNAILRQITKHEAHQKGLLHRTVIGEVRNSKGDWLLVKQSSKRQDAGQLVSPVGGHVQAGESEDDAFKRETLEEIGLQNFSYELVGRFIFNRQVIGRKENHYFIVYKIVTDKPLSLNHEADEYKNFSEQKLRELIKSQPELFGGAFYAVLENFYPYMLS